MENREEAQKLWNEIGMQYLRENEETLKEKAELLPKELEHYPVDGLFAQLFQHIIRLPVSSEVTYVQKSSKCEISVAFP